MKIINHENEEYLERYKLLKDGDKANGAFFYSKEICENIIPRVETQRPWVTINTNKAFDHAIVFIHNNLHPEHYDFLKQYYDVILVCGVPETCSKVSYIGKSIYLPLSVDVNEVEKYRTKKTKEIAFAGRPSKRLSFLFTNDVDTVEGLPREEFLAELAKYKKVYAVGRTAIEAKVLGCEILPYDNRYPNPDVWRVLDNSEASTILQSRLDEIDIKFSRKKRTE